MKKRIAIFLSLIFMGLCLMDSHLTYTVEAASSEQDLEEDRTHLDAGWKTATVGPVTFDAPKLWYVDQGVYSPSMQYKGCDDVFIAVMIFEDDFIEDYAAYDNETYDDVFEAEDYFDEYPAIFHAYTYKDSKTKVETTDLIYYIQLSSNGGVCALLYETPDSVYEEYVDDYFTVVNSLEIDKSKLQKSTAKTTKQSAAATTSYIANKNTKKFHYPYCSSVSQMKESNKLYYEGTRDELISKGYQPCKRCNP